MFRRAVPLVLALALLMASFASVPLAFAQGPGDEQYADPFGELPEEDPQPDVRDPAPVDPPPQAPSEPGSSTTTLAAEELGTVADAESAPSAAGDNGGEELARTGLPADLLTFAGLLLLSAGLALHSALTGRRPPTRAAAPARRTK